MKPSAFTAGLLGSALLLINALPASSDSPVAWQAGEDDNGDLGSNIMGSIANGFFGSSTRGPPLGRPLGNTLYDCSDSSAVLTIDYVNLTPDPPGRGAQLLIQASGTFSEPVVEGSYAQVVVKYGLIKLLNKRFDLCEEIKQMDQQCPLGPGKLSIVKTVDLPKQIPPGKYHVNARVLTKDNRQVTCLNAEITFGRGH